MPVLAYCITELEPRINVPATGVQGSAIKSLQESGLRCFVSNYSDQASTKPVRELALTFSRVLQDMFGQIAIIPFCFPTLLSNEAELSAFVRERAAQYHEDLFRLRDAVQMEVQVNFQQADPKTGLTKQSGKDYMRARQLRHQKLDAAVQEFRRAGQTHLQDWRQRDTATGIRGFALVPRAAVTVFLETMRRVTVPPDLNARITGPWPATEFFEEKEK
ncbi:MAG: hypothetical protein DMG71_10055 [Acidobacteria bacterium]|nr:MAG: hypothetical protein DMG71_10055 [Acidobacteriota bacterium]